MSRDAAGGVRPIGIFDSGIGGLSVLRHIRALLPREALIYVADQRHVPYGARAAAEVRALSAAITQFLLSRQAKLIVVACNTASAAALTWLRDQYPDVPFVGMEPAVKPGARATRTGRVGVLATRGTFGSPRYASLMHRFAADITVIEDPCSGLVELIEAGALTDTVTRETLTAIVRPMLDTGVDTLVLGCTHYPFVEPLIAEIAGPDVTIIDPAPAVARQVGRVLTQTQLRGDGDGRLELFTTGDPARLHALANTLIPEIDWPTPRPLDLAASTR